MINKNIFILFTIPLFVLSCSDANQTETETKSTNTDGRWYTAEQVTLGNTIYQSNCSSCHQKDASGTKNWKQPDANGNYPAPPLNGNAHTWHHSLAVLKRTVRDGGIRLGGTMPAFKNKLSDKEIEAALAWVQTNWSDEIYKQWSKRNK